MEDATPKQPTYQALRITLAAASDPTVTTEALRMYLGIAGTVWARESKEHGVAYLSREHLIEASGLAKGTLSRLDETREARPSHLESLARLGIHQVSAGQPRTVIDAHGMASSWSSGRSKHRPLDVARLPYNPRLYLSPTSKTEEDIEQKDVVAQSCNSPYILEGLARFFDPCNRIWSQSEGASSGWRLALVLTSQFGLLHQPINVTKVGRLMGLNKSNVSRALQRLSGLGLASANESAWAWSPGPLVYEIEHSRDGNPYLLDNRPFRGTVGTTRRWLADREAWLEEKEKQRKAEEESLIRGRRLSLKSPSEPALPSPQETARSV